MNRVSQVLTQDVSFNVSKSYRALANYDEIPHSTLHHRARERRSLEQKIES